MRFASRMALATRASGAKARISVRAEGVKFGLMAASTKATGRIIWPVSTGG